MRKSPNKMCVWQQRLLAFVWIFFSNAFNFTSSLCITRGARKSIGSQIRQYECVSLTRYGNRQPRIHQLNGFHGFCHSRNHYSDPQWSGVWLQEQQKNQTHKRDCRRSVQPDFVNFYFGVTSKSVQLNSIRSQLNSIHNSIASSIRTVHHNMECACASHFISRLSWFHSGRNAVIKPLEWLLCATPEHNW